METKGIDFASIPATAIRVGTSPASFFRGMPKTGGFVEPLVFAVAMGVLSGVVQAIVSILGLRIAAGMMMGLGAVIFVPVLVAIFSFVGAGIFFVIWKILGSQESYETAYRCTAYLSVLSPVVALLGLVPYVGSAAGLALTTLYLVTASVSVHGIASRKAWLVFGIIGGVLAISSVGAEIAARRVASQLSTAGKEWQGEMEKLMKQAEEMEKKAKEGQQR